MVYLLVAFNVCTQISEASLVKAHGARHKNGGFFFMGLISLFSALFFVITKQGAYNFSFEILPYAAIAGALYCMASFTTYLAFECGSFAFSNLILSYSLILPVIYGIAFLKESVTKFTVIGFVLLAVSLFLIRAESDGKRTFSVKWLVCIVISFVGNGLFGVVSRMQQIRFDDKNSSEFMIICLGISAVTLAVVGLIRDRQDIGKKLKNSIFYAAGAGLSNGATNFTSLIINTMIPISISSPMRSGAKIVLSMLFSYFVYKEKFIKRQIIGVIIGAAAVVFLNI